MDIDIDLKQLKNLMDQDSGIAERVIQEIERRYKNEDSKSIHDIIGSAVGVLGLIGTVIASAITIYITIVRPMDANILKTNDNLLKIEKTSSKIITLEKNFRDHQEEVRLRIKDVNSSLKDMRTTVNENDADRKSDIRQLNANHSRLTSTHVIDMESVEKQLEDLSFMDRLLWRQIIKMSDPVTAEKLEEEYLFHGSD